jgi:protein-L-isoaspartate(D-aspartate) O-methyltransferase
MNTDIARFNMIEQQIRPWEVLDQNVLSLLAAVRREAFVPPALQALAFVDTQVPLGEGQVMLEPKVEARLLQELQLQASDRVLEVGTGSGFMAALMAHQAGEVLSLECRPALAEHARQNLQRQGTHPGVSRVQVRVVSAEDSAQGLPSEPAFDAIVLSGSVAAVPDSLLQRLTVGGRLIAVVGELPVMRATLVRRVGEHAWAQEELFDTVAPRLEGFEEPSRFSF